MRARLACLLVLTSLGCNQPRTATDAGASDAPVTEPVDAPAIDAECQNSDDCHVFELPDCVDGRCVGPCWGVDGGTECNMIASDWPPECCTSAQHCCPVSFEWEECLTLGHPCPEYCPGNFWTYCSPDAYCVWLGIDSVTCADDCATGTDCDGRTCCQAPLVCGAEGCVEPPDAGPTP